MIRIICVGKLKENYMVNMVEDYLKRINKYHKITEVVKGFDGTFTLSKLKKLINEIKEIIENGN